MAEQVRSRTFDGGRLLWISAIVAFLGLVPWAVGAIFELRRALFAYLAAYAYVLSVVLGMLVLMMIGRAMESTWILVLRRLQEAALSALPVLALLFIPVVVGAHYLYPWANPALAAGEHVRELIEHKEPYLNMLFFVLRAVVYFAAWLIVGELLLRWSRRREGGREIAPGRETALAAGMLPIVALAITFAAFDWIMSLDPTWLSAIFGVYYFAGGAVGGLALAIVLAYRASRAGLLSRPDGGLTREHYHAAGRLLFGFIVFWAYVAFFQAMLIRMADKPEEVLFYIHRLSGSWEWVTYVLIFGHFVAPFFLLLPRRIKRRPAVLTAIASWVLIFHYLDIYWLVLPMLHEHGARPHWLDVAALAGTGGIATLAAVWRMRGRSLLPVGHPQLEHGLAYRSQSI